MQGFTSTLCLGRSSGILGCNFYAKNINTFILNKVPFVPNLVDYSQANSETAHENHLKSYSKIKNTAMLQPVNKTYKIQQIFNK